MRRLSLFLTLSILFLFAMAETGYAKPRTSPSCNSNFKFYEGTHNTATHKRQADQIEVYKKMMNLNALGDRHKDHL